MTRSAAELKEEILRLTREYADLAHRAFLPGDAAADRPEFVPGETTIPYAGRVFDGDEVQPPWAAPWISGSRWARRARRSSGNWRRSWGSSVRWRSIPARRRTSSRLRR